ncbi:MAG: hypothetical protein H7841_17975 [Magnetospirillum sp. WYHS-4]
MALRFVPILAVLLAVPAWAGGPDPDLPAVSPKGKWRVLTPDDATSTSRCIGRPETPLCAAETIVACFERTDKELCRIGMGRAPGQEYYDFGLKGGSGWKVYYQVVSAVRLAETDIPPKLRHPDEWRVVPGDIRIVIRKRRCWIAKDGREKCETGPLTQIHYFLRPVPGGMWRMVNKFSPRVD